MWAIIGGIPNHGTTRRTADGAVPRLQGGDGAIQERRCSTPSLLSRQCNPFTTVRCTVAPFSPAHLSPNRRAKVMFQPAHDFLTDFRNLGVVERAVRRAEH